uniref:Uncharacterized protein n=1 Tax=Aegilops tauschii TaxID=37682 RepID=N1QVX1_AEGTA
MADSKKVAVAGGKDRFEDLPEHVLELLLSFLDARDVVRTSVLARRWRDLWKSVPVLRFRPSSKFGCAENFNNFVNKVLECREQTSPLHECHVHSYPDGKDEVAHRDVESWVRYAVSCQVSVLRVLMLADGLVTFELQHCEEWTPILESMPSLATSSIIIGFESKDSCDNFKYLGDCGVEACEGCYVEDDCSVLLEGLSGATNLKLISEYSMIFRKDLKWCPMFSKLKTVLLNEWCLTANFTGLLHFLQHSPILEKLTLQFSYGENFDIESSESYSPSDISWCRSISRPKQVEKPSVSSGGSWMTKSDGKFPPVRVSAPSAIANLDPGSVRNLQTVSCFLLDPVTDPFATLMPLVVPDPVIVAAILATAHATRLTLKKTLSSTTLLALLNQSKFIGCAKILVTSHSTAPKSKLKAVY